MTDTPDTAAQPQAMTGPSMRVLNQYIKDLSFENPGSRVTESLGLVRGSSVRTRHIGQDIMALLRNIAGGEVHEYTKMLAEAREHAIDRMVEEVQVLEGLGTGDRVVSPWAEGLAAGMAAEPASPAAGD